MAHSEQVQRSFALVGEFLFHFSALEDRLNQSVGKLLSLNNSGLAIVCANLDFIRKLEIVNAACVEQNASPDEKWLTDDIRKAFNRIRAINDERVILAHSTFEPHADGGVVFYRTTARHGSLVHSTPHWRTEKFDNLFAEMERLHADLDAILHHIQPNSPSLDFSDPRNSQYIPLILG